MNKKIKKFKNYFLSICMIVSMLAGVDIGFIQWDGLAMKASAAEYKEYWEDWTILPTTGNTTLSEGGTYRVNATSGTVTVSTPGAGLNGLTIPANATVTIYIPEGVTLKVQGGAGSTTTGGGAGIYLPSSSALVIRGGGTLNATGGIAGSGSTGSQGVAGQLTIVNQGGTWYGGAGGTGGNGGGGAGAGIGTNGGVGSSSGGAGGGQSYESHTTTWYAATGNGGIQGGTGGTSGAMGALYVLDTVQVSGSGGSAGGQGLGGTGVTTGNRLTDKDSKWGNDYSVGNGGNGGGGGGGGSAIGIGSGGGGGGHGGGGGGGGRWKGSGWLFPHGFGGYGGNGGAGYTQNGTAGALGARSPQAVDGVSASGTITSTNAGAGGAAGVAGGRGGNGTVYKAAGAMVSGAASTNAIAASTLTYNANGGSLGDVPQSQIKYNNVAEYITNKIPQKEGYVFRGWANSETAVTSAYAPGSSISSSINQDITLYAVWTPRPTVSISRTILNERASADGGIADTLILSVTNGVFAAGAESNLQFANIPAGLAPKVDRVGNTMLLITFEGKAANRTRVDDARVAVPANQITYPGCLNQTLNADWSMESINFSFVFRQAAIAPNAPWFVGSDGVSEGPPWADAITLNGARLNSYVSITGGTIKERGFVYNPAALGEPVIGAGTVKVSSGSGTGPFSSSISGLTAGTEYCFRAYAITDGGTYYSQSESFQPSSLCSMGSTSVLPIKDTQATIVGNVLTDGGSSITETGVLYSASPNPAINASGTVISGNTVKTVFSTTGSRPGIFSVDLNDLNPNVLYYVRTYAINASGVAYGAQVTMNTLVAGLDEKTYLSNLTVEGGAMVPGFNKDVHSYMVSVPSKRNNIQLVPYLQFDKDPNVTVLISVDGQNWLSTNGTNNKSGKQCTVTGINGEAINVVYIRVTSQGKTRTYILNLISQPSDSADLANMILKEETAAGKGITYTPQPFDKDTTNYTAVVSSDTQKVYFELDMGDNALITAKINGITAPAITGQAKAEGTVTLTGPTTTVTLQTTSEDGKTTKTYTVVIIRPASSSAYLTNLKAGNTSDSSTYALYPGFEATQVQYGTAVPSQNGNIWMTPEFAAGSAISMSGTNAKGGALTIAAPDEANSYNVTGLLPGNNTVIITVTSPDGFNTSAYTVVVTRRVSDITKLNNLIVKANATNTSTASNWASQELLPAFETDETAYTVITESSQNFAYIAPEVADAGASYHFSGDPEYDPDTVISPDTPLILPLSPGSNEIFIHVIAADGSTIKTTAVNIIKKISSDAYLTDISGFAALSPAFDKDQGQYAVVVDYAQALVDVTGTPNESTAVVALAVNDVPQAAKAAGARTDTVNLNLGINTLVYMVTAQDGITTRTYTVTVVRTASSNAWLEVLNYTPGGIAQGTDYAKVPPNDGHTYETGTYIDDGNEYPYYYYVDGDGDKIIAMEESSGFDPYTLNYLETAVNSADSVTITSQPQDENAIVYINGEKVWDKSDNTKINPNIGLDVGNNEIIIRVVAQDGQTVKEYALVIVRAGADNCNLADTGGLSATNLTTPPGMVQAADGVSGYDPAQTEYKGTVQPRFDKTTITATAADKDARVIIRKVTVNADESITQTVLKDVTANGTSPATAIAADAELAVGENVFTAEVIAATGSSKIYTLTITREAAYEGLGASINPGEVKFPEGLRLERDGSYLLNHTGIGGTKTITLTPAGADKPVGPDADVTYELGELTGDTEVLTALPTLGEDGETISYAAATGIVAGKTATLEIIIHTPNYQDKSVYLDFKTVEKTKVVIEINDNEPENKVYDGDSVPEPDFEEDITITEEDDPDKDRTDDIIDNSNSEIKYEYSGTDSKGEPYGPTDEPPSDAGEYTLTITIIDEDYDGKLEIPFKISKKTLTIATAEHTKPYDSTNDAEGVTLTYTTGGILAADAEGVVTGAVTAEYTEAKALTKTVNITGVELTGTRAHNYTVASESSYLLSGTGQVGITKAAGLTATPPADITVYEKLKTAKTGTFNLNGITLTPPVGVTGAKSYTADTFSNGFNILTVKPTVSDSILNFSAAAGKAPNLTATQVITITTENYQDITVPITFRTIPRQALVITPDEDDLDKIYDGDPVNPDDLGNLTIKDGDDQDVTLKPGTNPSYSYEGYESDGTKYGPSATPPTNAGDYNLTITVEDDEHYGEIEIPFTIDKATPVVTLPSNLTATYGDTLADLLGDMRSGATARAGGKDVPGTFTWTSGGTTAVGPAGERQHGVTFTPVDSKNYNMVYENAVITVAKATPTVEPWPTVSGASYGKTLGDLTLTGGAAEYNSTNVAGTFTWNNPATKLDMDGGSYYMTFTPDDTENYNTVRDLVSVTVSKADGLVVSLRDPILYITAGTTMAGSYDLASPNVLLDGPASAPEDVTFIVTDLTGKTEIFTGGSDGISPNIKVDNETGKATLEYTPGGAQVLGDKAAVKITIRSSNYQDIETTIGFEVIDKKPVLISGLTPENGVYNGSAHNGYTGSPVITSSEHGIITESLVYTYTGRPGTTYGPSMTAPTNAGDYTLTVTLDSGSNYAGIKEINFTITKATPVIDPWPTAAPATYGDTLSSVNLTGGTASTPGAFHWTNGAVLVGNAGQRTHGVTFTPNDTANYNTVTGTAAVTVAKATPTVTWPTGLSGTYGNTLGSVSLSGKGSATGVGGAALTGLFTWDALGSKLDTMGSPAYNMTFTPSDSNNYNTAGSDVQITVGKASGLNVTPNELMVNIKLLAEEEAEYNVAEAIHFSRADTGTVTYTISGGLGGPDTGILTGNPTITAAGMLSYTPSGTKAAGQSASQNIKITTDHYEDVFVTVIFKVIPKTHVEIENIYAENGTYNGSSQEGYTGTPVIRSEDDGKDKFTELTEKGSITYIYENEEGDILPGPPTAPGNYKVTIKVEDDDYEGEKTIEFSIAKAAGLTADPDELTIKIRQTATAAGTLDLSQIISINVPVGSAGDVLYTLGALTGKTDIFSSVPTVGSTTGVLNYTPAATKTPDDEAVQNIKITCENYEDVYVTVKFVVVPKTEVTIEGLTAKDGRYDSSNPDTEHDGYQGTLEITNDEDGSDLTDILKDILEYSYSGTDSEGRDYDSVEEPPTKPGEYIVTISVPDSNIDYSGSLSLEFIVEKEVGPAAPDLAAEGVTNYGGSDGYITINDYHSYYEYEWSNDDGITWNDATVTSGGVIEDLSAGTYKVRVKETSVVSQGAAAEITISQPRGVILAINKDGQPWTAHGKTFLLKDDSDTLFNAASTSAGAAVHFNVINDGQYMIYENGADTGRTVSLNADDNSVSETINYYTISFNVADGTDLSGSTISATYDGGSITDGDIVLGGKELIITVADTAGADAFVYTWTGAGTSQASGDTLTIDGLNGKVEALCTITGVNTGITVSHEGFGDLKYDENVNAKVIYTLDDEDGTFEYADSGFLTLSFFADGTKAPMGEDLDKISKEKTAAGLEGDPEAGLEEDPEAGTEEDLAAGTEENPEAGTEEDLTAGTEKDSDAGTKEEPDSRTEDVSGNNLKYALYLLEPEELGFNDLNIAGGGGIMATNQITYQFNSSDFAVSGLGESGLTAGTAVRKSSMVVEVPITGKITGMGTITITVPAAIVKENIVNAQRDIPVNAAVSFTFTVGKAAQSAPDVSVKESHETDEHEINSIDTTMEFSTDGGLTWETYDGSNLPDLSGDLEIWVRYQETATHEASPSQVLTFHEKGTLGGTAEITGNTKKGQVLTVDTSSITGNASASTLRYQWYRNGMVIIGATAKIYTTVNEDVGANLTCVVTSTVENGSITSSGVRISQDDEPGAPSGSKSDNGTTPEKTPIPSPSPLRPESAPTPTPQGSATPTPARPAQSPKIPLPELPAETVKETAERGSGSVTIKIIENDGQQTTAEVVDTKTAVEAILTPQELEYVAAGEHVEIEIKIRHLVEEQKEVPQEDKTSIEDSVNQLAAQIAGLQLGKYIDITMQYRIGNGEWISIAEAREEIELVISIPADLLKDGASYYILRCHGGETVLLQDLDDDPETITIKTKLFSTYAIAYTTEEVPAEIIHAEKCRICGFCPMPLGLCIFIWLLIIIVIAVAVWLIVKRKKARDEENVEKSSDDQ